MNNTSIFEISPGARNKKILSPVSPPFFGMIGPSSPLGRSSSAYRGSRIIKGGEPGRPSPL
jgi:hypothetical protein